MWEKPQTAAAETLPRLPTRAARGSEWMGSAVLEALRYAHLFDWPLTAAEVHRFLPIAAQPDEVAAGLADARQSGAITSGDGLYFLPGHDALVDRRRTCEAASARLWPRAVRWCRTLAALPWVRLVAVSGSLAVGAAEDEADVDLFIVTVDGRVWLTRALTLAVGRASGTGGRRRGGVQLCPNYIVTTDGLALAERDFFTAHELAQLVPLFGPQTYTALLAANRWYRDFLPNHSGYSGPIAALRGRHVRAVTEQLLRNRLVSRLERWEMERKVARLSAQPARAPAELRFDRAACKGHFGGYRHRTLESLAARMVVEARA